VSRLKANYDKEVDRTLKETLLITLTAIASVMAVWAVTGLYTAFANYDGPYYLVIAKSWYDPEIIRGLFSFPIPLEYYPAHFPLYPLLIKAVSVLGVSMPVAMLTVTTLASIAGAQALYWIAKSLKWGNPLAMSLVWLFAWPRMWAVRSVGSPETLFVLWILLSLWAFGQKKYLLAGITGGLAVLTKSPGILLLAAYGLWALERWRQTKKIPWRIWPVSLISAALAGLFWFYYLKTGDFWAYFHSGDNIHLNILPFKIFDSSQSWVGSFWLEDIIWVYLVSAIGVWRAFRKDRVWGWWGVVFLTSILFVSHRDIPRYSLPLVPVVLLGLSELLEKREVRIVLLLTAVPLFFYTVNFVQNNVVQISNWGPLL